MAWQRDLPSRSRPRIQAVMTAVVETVCSLFAVYRCPGCQKELVVQAKAPDNRKYSLLTRVQTVTDHIRHQIPRSRLAERLRDLKLAHISDSLIWNWIKELSTDTTDLYDAIVGKTKASQLMQLDASGLPIHSVEEDDHRRDELTSKHWPLWQVQTLCTVVFFLTPRQYTNDLLVFFSERIAQAKATGERFYLLADRAKNIAALGKLGVEIAFCWVHLRRDFITLGNQHPGHLEFARAWTKLLRTAFRLYHKRRKQTEGSPPWHHCDAELREQIDKIRRTASEQVDDPKTPEIRKKVLASLQKHWHGLTLFLDHPFIPIHNNEVERRFRWLAIFRRISFGCWNEKSAIIRAQLYTVYHTLDINHLPANDYLLAFLQEKHACKLAKRKICMEEWLPWNLSPRVRKLVFKEL
jgi:transposase